MTHNSNLIDNSRPLDLICMGRVAVDLYAEQLHCPLEDVQSFRKYLGGSAGNTAVGSSRLGLKSAMFSCVGTDDMGVYLRKFLKREGVNTSLLRNTPDHLTALVLLGVDPPNRFPLIFYRENCADMQIKKEDINPEIFSQTKALLITGTGISTPAMRDTTLEAVKVAKSCGCAIVLDIDFRPVLWGLTEIGDGETRFVSSAKVTKELQLFLSELDLIVGTEEEIQICAGITSKKNSETIDSCISIIREQSSATIVLKRGKAGCEVFPLDLSKSISAHSYNIEVLNVLGAGDAFMSGFLRGWLREENLEKCALYGNACGALVVTRHGCSTSSPSFEEMDYFIKYFDEVKDLAHQPIMNQMHLRTELGNPQKNDLLILDLGNQIQFEKSCLDKGISLDLISEFKEQVHEGFKSVIKSNHNYNQAILVDTKYCQNILKNSGNTDYTIGVPIEIPNSLNLELFSDKSLYKHLLERPVSWFVKVICYYNLRMSSKGKNELLVKLRKLNDICISLKRKLMIELKIQDSFGENNSSVILDNQKSHDYPLSHAISELYRAGIHPFWWAIKTPNNEKDWDEITKKLDEFDPFVGVIIMDDEASLINFKSSLSIANSSSYNCGFAIGSSIFWKTWEKFIHEEINKSEIAELVSSNYQSLLNLWYNN